MLKWLCLFLLLAMIATCNLMNVERCRDWLARQDAAEDAQIDAINDLLRQHPTAAGKAK